ncbi:MAG: hypothetical protein ACWA45_01755 [Flavobacteriales bacterium]
MKTLILTTLFLNFILFPAEISLNNPLKLQQENDLVTYKNFMVNHEDYTLYFGLEYNDQNKPVLTLDIELYNDSYIVSPNSKRDFKGKLKRDFGDTQNIDFDGKLIEIPLSKEINNIYEGGKVNLIKENTTYKQLLLLKTKKDFQVFGRFIFTIEPRCTLETVPFSIIQKDGKLAFTEPKC